MRHGKLCSVGKWYVLTLASLFIGVLPAMLLMRLLGISDDSALGWVITFAGLGAPLGFFIRRSRPSPGHTTICTVAKWFGALLAANLVSLIVEEAARASGAREPDAVGGVAGLLAIITAVILNAVLKRPTITIIEGRGADRGPSVPARRLP